MKNIAFKQSVNFYHSKSGEIFYESVVILPGLGTMRFVGPKLIPKKFSQTWSGMCEFIKTGGMTARKQTEIKNRINQQLPLDHSGEK